jgi:hypothetical protein
MLNRLKSLLRSASTPERKKPAPIKVVEWIGTHAKGRTFADVGGLWGTKNERVSVALRGGAAAAAMIDSMPLDREEWRQFDERCAGLGVSGYQKFQVNLDDPDLVAKVGTYEVVHCSGVLYHCPNPVYSAAQLARLTREF